MKILTKFKKRVLMITQCLDVNYLKRFLICMMMFLVIGLEIPINNVFAVTETQKITASDAAAGDVFGEFVAISSDTVIVGARLDDDACTSDPNCDSGSAYIFDFDGTDWGETQKITASDAAAGDIFGHSVAVSGDTVVVGSTFDDDNGSNSGSAYVFTRSGITWTQQAKLTASDAAAGDFFGETLSVSGDTVVVGSRLDDDAGDRSGSAYVFEKPLTGWADTTEDAKLTASDAAAGDSFGYPVAVSGNIVVVGSFGNDDNGSDSGSAYIYDIGG